MSSGIRGSARVPTPEMANSLLGVNNLFAAAIESSATVELYCQTIVGDVGIKDPEVGFFCIVDKIDEGVKGLLDAMNSYMGHKLGEGGILKRIMPPIPVEDGVP